MSLLTLTVATANLKARIHSRGVSSGDVDTVESILQSNIIQQNEHHITNHSHNKKANAQSWGTTQLITQLLVI